MKSLSSIIEASTNIGGIMTRKLASIQRVVGTAPIEGADVIEIAFVLGWQVVVKKGEFKEGDLVVFYEIDSFLPASDMRYETFKERFTTWNGKEGMRLKTIKLRKALSQGLVLGVDKFSEIINPQEGDDVTELLKIDKWEVIEKGSNAGTRAMGSGKQFPPFIQKTDQERIQNYGALVSKALEEEFEATVKKDGSSLTVFAVQPDSKFYKIAKDFEGKKTKFNLLKWLKAFFVNTPIEPITGVCSRNVMLDKEGDSNFHKVVAKYELISKLLAAGKSYALQGELVAPDIQGNYEKVKEVEFHLFDIFDIENQKYLLPDERKAFAKLHGIPHVTVLGTNSLNILTMTKDGDNVVQKCLDYAEGKGDNNGVMREGVVFKSTSRDFSFKAISNSYLLKQK